MAYDAGTDPTLAELKTRKWVPEVFAKEAQVAAESNLVIANLVDTQYEDDLRFGYKINIPVLSNISATEVTPGSEAGTTDAAGTALSLTVDKWYEATLESSEAMQIENRPDYLTKAARKCGYAVAKQMDTHLGALFSTLANDSVYGSDGQTLTDDIIIAIMETLDEADVPDDGQRYIVTDPSSKADLLKIDKFVRNDYVRNPVVATGKFGDIYNMGLYITNNLTAASTGNYGAIFHREAIGLVRQRNMKARMIPMPWIFQVKYTVDALYGVGELRDDFGKSFYTRSS